MNKLNILIAIPSPDVVLPEFAFDNLPAVIAYTKKLPFIKNVWLTYQKGVRTDKNRNMILKRALDQGNIDYILWFDSDMLFPHDIVEKYFQVKEPEIIGCLYFKRGDKFEPVVYTKSDKPFTYRMLDPTLVPENSIVEVDGLGFGGMMVSMKLYEKMGIDKWTVYGEQFHIPEKGGNQLTHDINFCRIAKDKYNAQVLCHMGVRPGHIGDRVVDINTWLEHRIPEVGRIREQNINTAEYWDKKYTEKEFEYDNTTPKQTERWKLAREFIKEEDCVLDIGCGLGYFLETLENESIYGVDISDYAIKTAKKRLQRGEFARYDANIDELPFNRNFDVIFSGETLEHIENPYKIFEIAQKQLNKGGRLIITTPNRNRIDSPEHINGFDLEGLLKMADMAKLTPLRTQTIFGDSVFFVVFVKS